MLERLRALPDGDAEGRRDQADDRPRPDLHRLPGVPEVRHGQPLLRLQAGPAGGGRAPRARPACCASAEDIFFLTFQELHDVVRTQPGGRRAHRASARTAFRSYQALTPPRVLTSDGEAVTGAYRRDDVPAGALVGLPVSAGTVEGRARVILDMARGRARAGRHPGHRLHRPQLVAAVRRDRRPGDRGRRPDDPRRGDRPRVRPAGRRRRGAATRLIRDGQRIRVHGTDGYVEILP